MNLQTNDLIKRASQERFSIVKEKIIKGAAELQNCQLMALEDMLSADDGTREVIGKVEILMTHSTYSELIGAIVDGRSVDFKEAFAACCEAYKADCQVELNGVIPDSCLPVYEACFGAFAAYFIVDDDGERACVLCLDR